MKNVWGLLRKGRGRWMERVRRRAGEKEQVWGVASTPWKAFVL